MSPQFVSLRQAATCLSVSPYAAKQMLERANVKTALGPSGPIYKASDLQKLNRQLGPIPVRKFDAAARGTQKTLAAMGIRIAQKDVTRLAQEISKSEKQDLLDSIRFLRGKIDQVRTRAQELIRQDMDREQAWEQAAGEILPDMEDAIDRLEIRKLSRRIQHGFAGNNTQTL